MSENNEKCPCGEHGVNELLQYKCGSMWLPSGIIQSPLCRALEAKNNFQECCEHLGKEGIDLRDKLKKAEAELDEIAEYGTKEINDNIVLRTQNEKLKGLLDRALEISVQHWLKGESPTVEANIIRKELEDLLK